MELSHYLEPWERPDSGVQVTGSTLWDAGIALVAHMESVRPLMGEGPLSVLEIGAGCGAVGIALALNGDEVLVTDNQPEVLEILRENVERNEVGSNASVAALDWEKPPSLALASRGWHLIVAADVVYGLPHFTPLLRFLEALAHPRTTLVFAFGNKQRRSREDVQFIEQLRERNVFDIESYGVPVQGFEGVEVLTFRRKPMEWTSDDEDWLDNLDSDIEPAPEPELPAPATEYHWQHSLSDITNISGYTSTAECSRTSTLRMHSFRAATQMLGAGTVEYVDDETVTNRCAVQFSEMEVSLPGSVPLLGPPLETDDSWRKLVHSVRPRRSSLSSTSPLGRLLAPAGHVQQPSQVVAGDTLTTKPIWSVKR